MRPALTHSPECSQGDEGKIRPPKRDPWRGYLIAERSGGGDFFERTPLAPTGAHAEVQSFTAKGRGIVIWGEGGERGVRRGIVFLKKKDKK